LIDNPTHFATKARELSDDKQTASKGGLLKPFAKGEHNSIFDRTAFLLPTDDAISEVIRTDEGFELLQRVSKTQITFKSLASVKKEIKHTLIKQKFAHHFARDIQELQDRGGSGALREFIENNQGGMLKKYDFKERESNKISQALFSLAGLEDFTFFIEGDKGVLVRLDGIQARALPELSSIKDDVLSDVYEKRTQERIKDIMHDARERAIMIPLHEVAQLLAADYQETGFITPDKAEAKKNATLKNLPIETMLKLEKPDLMMVHHTQRNSYLIQCKGVASLEEGLFESKKGSLDKEVGTERMRIAAGAFVASLYRDATIEMNKQQASE
jgi:hypothetical protein